MTRSREATASLGLAITLGLLLAAFAAQAIMPGPVVAASDRLPNLKMLPLRDWHIQNESRSWTAGVAVATMR